MISILLEKHVILELVGVVRSTIEKFNTEYGLRVGWSSKALRSP